MQQIELFVSLCRIIEYYATGEVLHIGMFYLQHNVLELKKTLLSPVRGVKNKLVMNQLLANMIKH